MKTMFLVEGTTGEYADRSSWIVCAFNTKAGADNFSEKCNAHLSENGLSMDDLEGDHIFDTDLRDEVCATSPDPGCRIDYTGSDYRVIEVPHGRPKANK